MSGYWEHFAHEADIGVRGVGTTREEVFEQAPLAMIAVDRERHQPAVEVKGATYTELRVAREGGKRQAQTVIDV